MEEFDNQGPYCDPNAYIQKVQNHSKQTKKVVFQEPYECIPQYRMNNNFKKGDCDCVNCREKKESKPNFDIKNFLPIISSLGGDGVGNIMKLFSGNSSIADIMSDLGGEGGLGSILKGFDISKMFKKSSPKKHEMKSTDFCIKDYKKVD